MNRSALWQRRQVLGAILGMTPVLVLCQSVLQAIIFLLIHSLVLLGSHSLLHTLRHLVPLHQRTAYSLLVVAFMTTVIYLALSVLTPSLVAIMGVLIPLAAVQPGVLENSVTLRAESRLSMILAHHGRSILVISIVLVSLGLFRELVGNGTILLWRAEAGDTGLDLTTIWENPIRILLDSSMVFFLVGAFLMAVPLDQEDPRA